MVFYKKKKKKKKQKRIENYFNVLVQVKQCKYFAIIITYNNFANNMIDDNADSVEKQRKKKKKSTQKIYKLSIY